MSIVSIIQSMLVPGILISACGLLLLATNSKYSLVISRIRALGEEKRKIELMDFEAVSERNNREGGQPTKTDETATGKALKKHVAKLTGAQNIFHKRLKSVALQYSMLILRMKYLRNAVLCYHLAVAFFIFTCLAIGFQLGAAVFDAYFVIVAMLHLGIFFMLLSVYFGFREALLGYKVLKVEIGGDSNTQID